MALSVGTATRPRSGRVAGTTSVPVTSDHRSARGPPASQLGHESVGSRIVNGPAQAAQFLHQIGHGPAHLLAIRVEEGGDHRRVTGNQASRAGEAGRGKQANGLALVRDPAAGYRGEV